MGHWRAFVRGDCNCSPASGERRVTDVEMLLRIAQQLDVSPSRLGLSDELLRPVSEPSDSTLVGEIDPGAASQERWRRTAASPAGRSDDLLAVV
ncbi:MAG: hypothetical protein QOJ30_2023 [Pseudonocardiales bacterium]|nr:hypothetical protein [Pseudonocardiales bacterium]